MVEQGMALSGARFWAGLGWGLSRMGVAKQEVVLSRTSLRRAGVEQGLQCWSL